MKKVKEGYKMTELGEIPEEWEVKELNDITSVITKGTTPTTYGYDFEDEGINFIKIESINDMKGTLLEETFSKISEECHKKLSRSILEEDDILFAIAGATIGKCAITTKECLPANTNQALAIIRLNQNIDSKFIFHQLRGPLIQNKIENLKTNTAQPNLNLKQIGEFTILLPTLKEQQKLSLILNCVDEQIENTDNLIEKTKELKKGLMEKLLINGIGHSSFKETEIGKIPEEWDIVELDKIINCHRTISYGVLKPGEYVENGVPLIRIMDIKGNKINVNVNEFHRISKELDWQYKKTKLDGSEILISLVGTVGNIAITKIEHIGMNVHRNIGIIPIDEKKANKLYFAYCLQSDIVQKNIKFKTIGGNQPLLNLEDVRQIKVSYPSLEEQEKIASILLSVDEQIGQYESKNEKLQELKKGLMQKLLTGKIRVH